MRLIPQNFVALLFYVDLNCGLFLSLVTARLETCLEPLETSRTTCLQLEPVNVAYLVHSDRNCFLILILR